MWTPGLTSPGEHPRAGPPFLDELLLLTSCCAIDFSRRRTTRLKATTYRRGERGSKIRLGVVFFHCERGRGIGGENAAVGIQGKRGFVLLPGWLRGRRRYGIHDDSIVCTTASCARRRDCRCRRASDDHISSGDIGSGASAVSASAYGVNLVVTFAPARRYQTTEHLPHLPRRVVVVIVVDPSRLSTSARSTVVDGWNTCRRRRRRCSRGRWWWWRRRASHRTYIGNKLSRTERRP